MSSPWAQCSASRVVARVRGLSGAAAQDNRCSGSAARSVATADRRATRQRSNTSAGVVRSVVTNRSASSSTASPTHHMRVPTGRVRRRGAGDDGCLGLGEVEDDVGYRPSSRCRRAEPRLLVEVVEDRLEPILLGHEVVKDVHSLFLGQAAWGGGRLAWSAVNAWSRWRARWSSSRRWRAASMASAGWRPCRSDLRLWGSHSRLPLASAVTPPSVCGDAVVDVAVGDRLVAAGGVLAVPVAHFDGAAQHPSEGALLGCGDDPVGAVEDERLHLAPGEVGDDQIG